MFYTQDVHKQFANYFPQKSLKPYLYLLSKKLSEGHICINLDQINKAELIAEGFDQILGIEELKNEELVSNGTTYQPLVLHNNHLYLQRYFHYETLVFNKIMAFIEKDKTISENNKEILLTHKSLIQNLFSTNNSDRIDWQLIAAISVVLNQFTIITGGPGTGKTTTVAKVLSLLFQLNPELKVALAAPTGKAATRMAESLKNTSAVSEETKAHFETLVPSTIHRLLKSKKNSIYFQHNQDNPIAYDLVIIDESSMIDIALFAKLLDAIQPNTKVILLGDKDQLASVEAGSLFGDLCLAQPKLNLFSEEKIAFLNEFILSEDQKLTDIYKTESTHPLFEHVIELRYSHRFSGDEGIGKFSKAIIENDEEAIKNFFKNEDQRVFIDTDYSEQLLNEFVMAYQDFILEEDIKTALHKLNKLRVLCAVRQGPQGVYALNEKIQKLLQSQKFINVNTAFYEHRPIIVNSNNYELGLFNGDIGIVRKDAADKLKVWFEDSKGKLKSILPAFIDAAETVFAMTIHKSQGSEFEKVWVVLPKGEDNPLLTRELLYTAVTRAKEHVVVQGSEQTILSTASAQVKRGSGMIGRF